LNNLLFVREGENAMMSLRVEFRQIVHVGCQHLDAVDVVQPVEFLVLGVRAVIRHSHRQKHHVLFRRFLERKRDRDRATYKNIIFPMEGLIVDLIISELFF